MRRLALLILPLWLLAGCAHQGERLDYGTALYPSDAWAAPQARRPARAEPEPLSRVLFTRRDGGPRTIILWPPERGEGDTQGSALVDVIKSSVDKGNWAE
jgi:hypothetical protein